MSQKLDEFQIARLMLKITEIREQWRQRHRDRRLDLVAASPMSESDHQHMRQRIDDAEIVQTDLDDLLDWLESECGPSPTAGMPAVDREAAAPGPAAAPGSLTSSGWTVDEILVREG